MGERPGQPAPSSPWFHALRGNEIHAAPRIPGRATCRRPRGGRSGCAVGGWLWVLIVGYDGADGVGGHVRRASPVPRSDAGFRSHRDETPMARTARRRPTPAPRLDVLEARTLLDGDRWALAPPDPARNLLVRFADRVPAARAQATARRRGRAGPPDAPRRPGRRGARPGCRSRAPSLRRLRRDPAVRYAEPDAAFRSAEVFSNDPSLARSGA